MGRELRALVPLLLLLTTVNASAADPTPKDCENAKPAGTATLTPHSLQPQKNWQRQGKDVDIVTAVQKAPGNPRVAACFRWALQDRTVPGADAYAAFVPTLTMPAKIDKDSGKMSATVTVPEMIERPKSNAYAQPGDAIGVFSRNNTYPNAEVRVLIYDGDTLVATTSGLVGVIESDNYCDIPGQETTTGSGIGELGEHKNWQPVGGAFDFTVTTSKVIPPDALVKVCFRWKLTRGDPGRYHDSPAPKLTDSQPRSVKMLAAVPHIPSRPSWFWSRFASSDEAKIRRADYAVLGFAVPRADARILIFDKDSSPLADVSTTVGITQVWFATVVVIVGLSALFTVLYFACRYRLTATYKSKPFLCLISTRKGFASLSQFQIILWTFVVLASVIYVIALSGDLIEITTGTLVLLGISGAATVVAKAKAETDDAKPTTVPDSVAAAEDASVARYEADQLKVSAQAAPDDQRKDAQAAAEEADTKAVVAEATAALADAMAAALKARTTIGTTADDASRRAATQAAQAADDMVLQRKKELAIASARAAKLNRVRHPRWSDLVMEETLGREIDVTRVQMLCFTAVSALFVLLSVVTNYEIPDIPQGYLILMGISNSVYVGSKFAVKT